MERMYIVTLPYISNTSVMYWQQRHYINSTSIRFSGVIWWFLVIINAEKFYPLDQLKNKL